MFFFDKASTTTSRRRDKVESENVEKKQTLPIKSSVRQGGSLQPDQVLKLTMNMPLLSIDTTLLVLKDMTDSLDINSFSFKADTLNPLLFFISNPWQANKNYRLTVFPNAFVNLDRVTNDTINFDFKGADPEKFGTIRLDLTAATPNVIVELTKGKGDVVDLKTVSKDSIVYFNFVPPGKYSMRFTIDENLNGKWDTGLYLEKLQPEKVIIYEDENRNREIQVRENWEYEITFNLENTK
jgi:hypothetical protein